MKVPEKLYVDTEDNITGSILYGFTEKDKDDDIEYVRKDAFVEKAINFLEILGYAYTIIDNITKSLYDNTQLIEDFKKYMEE